MIAEGSTQIIWTLYFVLISKNSFYFIYFTIGLTALSLFLCIWVSESPRYLFGMEKFEECREVLSSIAQWNGTKDYEPPVFEEENTIMVEDIDDDDIIERINPSGPVSPDNTEGSEDRYAGTIRGKTLFKHLSKDELDRGKTGVRLDQGKTVSLFRATRYMTAFG